MTDATQADALRALIGKVEAGEYEPDMFCPLFHGSGQCQDAESAFGGSIDAAKALHEALLPGWTYCDHLWRGLRYTSYIGKGIEDDPVHAVSSNPARAWLLSILKAKLSETQP